MHFVSESSSLPIKLQPIASDIHNQQCLYSFYDWKSQEESRDMHLSATAYNYQYANNMLLINHGGESSVQYDLFTQDVTEEHQLQSMINQKSDQLHADACIINAKTSRTDLYPGLCISITNKDSVADYIITKQTWQAYGVSHFNTEHTLHNTFLATCEMVSLDQRYFPSYKAEKPIVHSLQTATVFYSD